MHPSLCCPSTWLSLFDIISVSAGDAGHALSLSRLSICLVVRFYLKFANQKSSSKNFLVSVTEIRHLCTAGRVREGRVSTEESSHQRQYHG